MTLHRLIGVPRRLLRERRGIAATEFALIAPVFFVLLMGLFDIAHETYARSVFVGAVETAARQAALETGSTTAADKLVKDRVKLVLPDVVIVGTRKSYYDFADIARPEQFTDNKGKDGSGNLISYAGLNNGKCDAGETFLDFNKNAKWDADTASGAANNGGAGDVVMYTVTATFTPLFKIPFAPGLWSKRTMTTTAVKKNQPFGLQKPVTTGTCP